MYLRTNVTKDYYNGSLTVNTSSPSFSSRNRGSKTYTNTPNYKLLKVKRELPDNPYSLTDEVISPMSYGYLQFNKFDKTYYGIRRTSSAPVSLVYGHASYLDPSYFWINELDARRVTKLLLKVKDQKVNMMQVIAERRQIFDMMNLTVKRLSTAVILLREGRPGMALNALRASHGLTGIRETRLMQGQDKAKPESVFSAWLSIAYGWKPALQDLFGAAEQLASTNLNENLEKARTRDFKVMESSVRTPGSNAGSIYTTLMETVEKRTTKITIGYQVKFSLFNSPEHTMAKIGLTNPAYLAWELLPFSFVYDWILPLGNYINSWDATFGLKFKSGTKTVKIEQEYRMEGQTIPRAQQSANQWQFEGTKSSYQRKVTFSRTVLNDFPFPAIPHFKNPFSTHHIVNGLALFGVLTGATSKQNPYLSTAVFASGGIVLFNDLKEG